jgi:hypothetical protein
MAKQNDDGIDYTAEGDTPPHEKHDPTDEGYDEAAHHGGAYGLLEGRGGVFGTTGGGSYGGGFHVEERPAVGDGGVETPTAPREADPFRRSPSP